MKHWSTRPKLIAAAVSVVFLGAVAMGSAQPRGADEPVTRDRLAGARLTAIDKSHSWTFTQKTFVLASGKKNIPADLVKALLGPDRKASRIEGKWDLRPGVLTLSAISADGKQAQKDAKLKVEPAGLIRVNIGKEQYNFGN